MLVKIASWMGLKELEKRDPAESRSFFFMIFMFMFLNADTMLMNPTVKLIMEEFKVGEKDVGLVFSFFVFSGAAVAILWGYMVDRYPRKLLAFFTIIIGEIPCLLTGYVDSYRELFIVRALTGLGIGGMMPIIYSMASDLVSDKERSAASAWLGLAEGLGAGLGAVLAGYLCESSVTFLGAHGWRLPFVLVALPNFVLAPLFLLTCKEPKRGGGEGSLQQNIAEGLQYKRRIKLSDYKTIFSNRTNIYAFLQSVPGTIGWGVLPSWMIAFFSIEKLIPIARATDIYLVIGIGMILGGFFGGVIGNKIHEKSKRYLPIFCGVTTMIGLVLFFGMIHFPIPANALFSQMLAPIAIGTLAGLFITMTSSNIRAMALNVNPPENRGAMMSLFTLTDSLGKGAGPAIGGFMISAFGYITTMDVATACWIPCALVFLLLLTPQYPKDAARLENLMAQRAAEMKR